MKILTLLGLDKESKDKKAVERVGKALAREQDILINNLSGKVDELEIKKEKLEELDLEALKKDGAVKTWVDDYQSIDIEIELAKKKLEIAERTKLTYFTEEAKATV